MIVVEIFKPFNNTRISLKDFNRVVRHVCMEEKIKSAEFSFVLVNDKTIKKLNKNFLHHNYVTDIITFPLEEKGVNAEIYINMQQMKRQAKKHQIVEQEELVRLIVHGTLHAFGYDDIKPEHRKVMFEKQEQYVAQIGLRK